MLHASNWESNFTFSCVPASKTNRSAPDLKATGDTIVAPNRASAGRCHLLAFRGNLDRLRIGSAQWAAGERRRALEVHLDVTVEEQRLLITHPDLNHLHPPVGQKTIGPPAQPNLSVCFTTPSERMTASRISGSAAA
ncbi:hypothetical protein Ssi02_72490 [Sinosporangium siamense]|uniref:Uncharacterized protein n=1 Tax=Sinosporangium siamense TaxID=1367973 RepID=A0A919RNM2_9ACTN|nr:hypothetical protein Ssi02_72490 [Sinosporangium siamense]